MNTEDNVNQVGIELPQVNGKVNSVKCIQILE